MKKLLILGSIVSACPPDKQGGTERVAYYQAKYIAKSGIPIIFIGASGTIVNFRKQLEFEQEEDINKILENIEFVEIGGGTGIGNQEDAKKIDASMVEGSRLLRLEMVNISFVIQILIDRRDDYDTVVNNMRSEAVFLPILNNLNKKFINVAHLNIFDELAGIFRKYKTDIITVSNSQREGYNDLSYLETIYNPVNTKIFSFNQKPEHYALMISTIGSHKNQKDAMLACKEANIKLILSGKIRDQEYFDKELKPFFNDDSVEYLGELDFYQKVKLYQEARVFLFPIKWHEPFGLVLVESLSCGTPIISYPNGGPSEIVLDSKNGYLVNDFREMADRIVKIENIRREDCRKDAEERFSDYVIGKQYFEVISPFL